MADEETRIRLTGKTRLVVFLLCVITGAAPYWYAKILSLTTATDPSILKSLIDADAALIGFIGLIVVYILNSNRDAIRNAEEDLHNEELNKRKYLRILVQGFAKAQTPTQTRLDTVKDAEKLYDKRIGELQKHILRIKRGSHDTILILAMSLTLLVLSIFATLLLMSNIYPSWRELCMDFSTVPIPIVLALLFTIIFFHAKEIYD